MMKKWLLVLLILPLVANAAYQRNTAQSVNEVKFGKVQTVRYFGEQHVVQSSASGLETLAGAVVGGVVGHQFGGGSGKDLATAVGAVAGASIANDRASKEQYVKYELVELLIETEKGELISVVQDVDDSMIFSRGEGVRILYFDHSVRVDKEYW
jgi:outer membrane lipoprotein SlyB